MKNFETLEVGKTYRNRRGELIKIIGKTESVIYPFVSEFKDEYMSNGGYNMTFEDSTHNLIELIEKTQTNNEAKMEKIQTIEEIDAKIAELQELRKELDKSVEVSDKWFVFRIQVRNNGEYSYKGFYLSRDYNWEIIKENDNDLVLVPTKK
jgi:hypothetical protein